MHRQSLGSPNSKLHNHGGVVVPVKEDDLTVEEQKRKDQASTLAAGADDDEVRKSQKPQKSPEKFIHLIPMLIIFCFLILYLSSHDPSQKDLTHFNGFKRISKPIELSSEVDDFVGLLEIEKSDVLAIRSLRNLQEIDKQSQKNQRHRKIGDF